MKFFRLLMLTAAVAGLAACNGSGSTALQRTEADAARKAKADPNDSTLYVTLDAVKGDSLYVTNSETGRKLALSAAQLIKNGKAYGNLVTGDSYALMTKMKTREISSSINVTELQGLWLLCDRSGNGMRIDEDGSASNIGELNGITLCSWRVMNGLLVISCVKSDGSDYEEKEHNVDISFLSESKLSFVYNGSQYDFSRE